MKRKLINSERIVRGLTPEEQKKLACARTETEAARETILAQGRARKALSLGKRP